MRKCTSLESADDARQKLKHHLFKSELRYHHDASFLESLVAEVEVEEKDNPSHWYEQHGRPPSPRRPGSRRVASEEGVASSSTDIATPLPPPARYVKVSKADIDGMIIAVDRTQVAVSHGIKIFESAANAFKEERSRLDDIKEALHGMSSSSVQFGARR